VGKRRKGREVLLQALYAAAVGGFPLPRALHDQLDRREGGDETAAFARELAVKVDAHLEQVDRWLAGLVEHWDPERLGEVERAVLRLALTELRCCPEVPPAVVINEACELARRYASEEAVPFVNGVLDRAARQVAGAAPAPALPDDGAAP
jgi:N utilization substance protein B